MRVTVLLAHPRPSSFNHGIAEVARLALIECGHDVTVHDLYDEGFDPVLRADECYTTGTSMEQSMSSCSDPLVAEHRVEIGQADGLVIVHPNWWGKAPAILAGWLDRVLVPGVAYRLADATAAPEGLLHIRSALVINTTDTTAEREANALGDPLQAMWTRCVLPYCGASEVDRLVLGPVTDSSPDERDTWLSSVQHRVRSIFVDGPIVEHRH